jgi:hypothetical protein
MLNDPTIAVGRLEKAIRGDARYHERANQRMRLIRLTRSFGPYSTSCCRRHAIQQKGVNQKVEGLRGRGANLLPIEPYCVLQNNDETRRYS